MKICDRCEGKKDVKQIALYKLPETSTKYFDVDLCYKCRCELATIMKEFIKSKEVKKL